MVCWGKSEEEESWWMENQSLRISNNKFSIILHYVSSEIPLDTQGFLCELIICWFVEMYFTIAQPTLMYYLLFI